MAPSRLVAPFVVSLSLAAAAILAGEQSANSAPSGSSAQTQALPAGYAGTDSCVLCHDEQGKSIEHSKHGQKANPRSPAATLGCESCHGPGQAHIDDEAKGHIKRFATLKPADDQRDVPDLPQSRQPRRLGRQRRTNHAT